MSGGSDAWPAGEPATGPGSLLISSFSSLPGLKYGTFFGGTSTLSPVFGLRPFRGSRLRSRKLPNPRSSIFSPRCRASMMLLKTVSTMTSECFFVKSDTRETSSTSSALVMLPPVMGSPFADVLTVLTVLKVLSVLVLRALTVLMVQTVLRPTRHFQHLQHLWHQHH